MHYCFPLVLVKTCVESFIWKQHQSPDALCQKNDRTSKYKRKIAPLKIIKDRRNDEKMHSVEDDLMEPCVSHADNNMEVHNEG